MTLTISTLQIPETGRTTGLKAKIDRESITLEMEFELFLEKWSGNKDTEKAGRISMLREESKDVSTLIQWTFGAWIVLCHGRCLIHCWKHAWPLPTGNQGQSPTTQLGQRKTSLDIGNVLSGQHDPQLRTTGVYIDTWFGDGCFLNLRMYQTQNYWCSALDNVIMAAVLYVIRRLATFGTSAYQIPLAPPPDCDNPKYLQALPSVPWSVKSHLSENHWEILGRNACGFLKDKQNCVNKVQGSCWRRVE